MFDGSSRVATTLNTESAREMPLSPHIASGASGVKGWRDTAFFSNFIYTLPLANFSVGYGHSKQEFDGMRPSLKMISGTCTS